MALPRLMLEHERKGIERTFWKSLELRYGSRHRKAGMLHICYGEELICGYRPESQMVRLMNPLPLQDADCERCRQILEAYGRVQRFTDLPARSQSAALGKRAAVLGLPSKKEYLPCRGYARTLRGRLELGERLNRERIRGEDYVVMSQDDSRLTLRRERDGAETTMQEPSIRAYFYRVLEDGSVTRDGPVASRPVGVAAMKVTNVRKLARRYAAELLMRQLDASSWAFKKGIHREDSKALTQFARELKRVARRIDPEVPWTD